MRNEAQQQRRGNRIYIRQRVESAKIDDKDGSRGVHHLSARCSKGFSACLVRGSHAALASVCGVLLITSLPLSRAR